MVQVKDLTELRVADLWKEVKEAIRLIISVTENDNVAS